jgi:hypothetical protein
MRPPSQSTLTLDDTTRASNPGRLNVEWLVYHRCFPAGAIRLAVRLTFAIIALAVAGGLLGHPWIVLFWLPLLWVVVVYVVHVQEHFAHGDTNPAVVVGRNLVAVYTDLSTGRIAYPVVKVLHQPLARGAGGHPPLGARLAAVSLYGGFQGAVAWSDFFPVAVSCVTSDHAERDRLLASIPREQWDLLACGVTRLTSPPKPGLYPLTPP